VQFAVIYKERNPSEEGDRRVLQLFSQWEPPFTFVHHYAKASGGGIAIIEADTAASVIEGISPWLAFLEFEVSPAVPIEEAVPIFAKTNDWRDSVA
jgi:hypothetical protein